MSVFGFMSMFSFVSLRISRSYSLGSADIYIRISLSMSMSTSKSRSRRNCRPASFPGPYLCPDPGPVLVAGLGQGHCLGLGPCLSLFSVLSFMHKFMFVRNSYTYS